MTDLIEQPIAPRTTTQEDLTVAGQRRINLLWESTQAVIAVFVTIAIVFCTVRGIEGRELVDAFFLIIGFYFSRTNHMAIGGIGSKPIQNYVGR